MKQWFTQQLNGPFPLLLASRPNTQRGSLNGPPVLASLSPHEGRGGEAQSSSTCVCADTQAALGPRHA